jgi:hypothetical protein
MGCLQERALIEVLAYEHESDWQTIQLASRNADGRMPRHIEWGGVKEWPEPSVDGLGHIESWMG